MAFIRFIEGVMSKVYSFRLDSDNLREALAIEVIDARVTRGYSLRRILTDALINLEENAGNVKNWDRVYDQLSELIYGLENGMVQREKVQVNSTLSSQFVLAVKNSVKSGLTSK